ncbi:MAG: sugar ABC transporter ATP-binding protein [Planctomycetota bacterium]|jgi:ribose transport system ATP-binding protein|nr:sugar ABC transporter ATP-binding protein [Planctomycetota bacterium]
MTADGGEIIRLQGVCKGLYDLNGKTLNRGVPVLSDINFSLEKGEIHVLLGENGAGKSSLVKVVCGAIEPDRGRVFIEGGEIPANDPQQALASGVAIVSQEFSLCPNLSVAENISLGREEVRAGGFLDRKATRAAAAAQLARLEASYIDPDRKVRHLPVAEQQLVEIAKALAAGPRVLILDEPTSALTDNQVEMLFRVLRLLKAQGVSMIYITHKLKEIFEVGDRVTVLRDGRTIRTIPVGEIADVDAVIQMMIGSKLENLFHKESCPVGDVALEVDNLVGQPGDPPLSLEVRRGEIVGLAGIVGAGRTELARMIFGVDGYVSGRVRVFGKELPKGDPNAAIAAGVGFIPEDRKRQGLVPLMSVAENMCHVSMRRLSEHGFIGVHKRRALAAEYVGRLKVAAASLGQEIRYLSGGNQQKVILGKWLSANARLFIFDEPTRGIDVGTKSAIYRLMVDLAKRGAAILMISSELQEIVGMSDRVYVMRGRRVAAALAGGEIAGDNILRYAMGGDELPMRNAN